MYRTRIKFIKKHGCLRQDIYSSNPSANFDGNQLGLEKFIPNKNKSREYFIRQIWPYIARCNINPPCPPGRLRIRDRKLSASNYHFSAKRLKAWSARSAIAMYEVSPIRYARQTYSQVSVVNSNYRQEPILNSSLSSKKQVHPNAY